MKIALSTFVLLFGVTPLFAAFDRTSVVDRRETSVSAVSDADRVSGYFVRTYAVTGKNLASDKITTTSSKRGFYSNVRVLKRPDIRLDRGRGHHHGWQKDQNPGTENKPPAQTHIVPAPGAIVLSAMGAGIVGWLRSRRSL